MSVGSFELVASRREDVGTLVNRRARSQKNQIPAILYGGKEANEKLYFDHNKLLQASAFEKFYSQILTINIDNHKTKAILKDLQRHPFKPKILHLDFQRVKETDVVTMSVPLHFVGTDKCPGVKFGGLVNHHANNVEIRCQARFLPEFIEVNLSNLEIGQIIHLSELKMPEHVEIAIFAGQKTVDKIQDMPVVSVHAPKTATVEETATTEAATDSKDTKAQDSKSDNKDNKDNKKDKDKK